jgi:amidase
VDDAIAYLPLLELAQRLRDRSLTSEGVTRHLLDRIARLDPALRSFQRVLADSALAQARAADAEIARGKWRGPLHGVPIGIKDLIDLKGEPTTVGMALRADHIADADATVTARLKAAGAVIIGKLRLTEGAHLNHHPAVPHPVNPWSADRWTGVSSSGSGVASAAGLCFGALGTDTGGSIRMPSAACNLSGIKPTWGRVSLRGLFPLATSLDHVGPMARSVADAAAILHVIAGEDPDDPTTLHAPVPDYGAALLTDCSSLVIGIDWDFACEGMAPEIVTAMREAARLFAELGAEVREVRMPSTTTLGLDTAAMVLAEMAAAHADTFPAQAEGYGTPFCDVLAAAQGIDGIGAARAYQARDRFRGRLLAMLDGIDLLLTPGLGGLVPTWAEFEAIQGNMGMLSRGLLRFTVPFNMAGVPTLSFPGGFTADGVPIGLQLVAAPLAEPVLIRAGHAFQQVTDYHERRPSLD